MMKQVRMSLLARRDKFRVTMPDGKQKTCEFYLSQPDQEGEDFQVWLFFQLGKDFYCGYMNPHEEKLTTIFPIENKEELARATAFWNEKTGEIGLMLKPLETTILLTESLDTFFSYLHKWRRHQEAATLLKTRISRFFILPTSVFLVVSAVLYVVLLYYLPWLVLESFWVGMLRIPSTMVLIIFLCWSIPMLIVTAFAFRGKGTWLDCLIAALLPYLLHAAWMLLNVNSIAAGIFWFVFIIAVSLMVVLQIRGMKKAGGKPDFLDLYARCIQPVFLLFGGRFSFSH